MSDLIRNGDVVLVDGLGQGWVSASIALGNRLRLGRGSPYIRWTHVALVYDAETQNEHAIKIVEATAATKVHTAFLAKYAPDRRKIVHTGVNELDWQEMKLFLDDVLRARESYDYVAYFGLLMFAISGTHWCIQDAGTATCSGLVADALTRAGRIWDRPPYAMTPAFIAMDLDDDPPEAPAAP